MKKLLFNLQLFADDPTPETGTDPENTPKDKEPATEPKKDTDKADEKVFTHAEFNELFNKKQAELKAKEKKELDEAKKLAEMNAQEQAEYKFKQEQEAHEQTRKQLDEYKRKDTLAEMTKTARKMLTDEGISISDDLLSVMVTDNAETTKASITSFAKMYAAAVENGVKERLKGEPPKVSTGSASPLSEIDKRLKKYE